MKVQNTQSVSFKRLSGMRAFRPKQSSIETDSRPHLRRIKPSAKTIITMSDADIVIKTRKALNTKLLFSRVIDKKIGADETIILKKKGWLPFYNYTLSIEYTPSGVKKAIQEINEQGQKNQSVIFQRDGKGLKQITNFNDNPAEPKLIYNFFDDGNTIKNKIEFTSTEKKTTYYYYDGKTISSITTVDRKTLKTNSIELYNKKGEISQKEIYQGNTRISIESYENAIPAWKTEFDPETGSIIKHTIYKKEKPIVEHFDPKTAQEIHQ